MKSINPVLTASLEVAKREHEAQADRVSVAMAVLVRQIAEYAEAVGPQHDDAIQFAINVMDDCAEAAKQYVRLLEAIAAKNIDALREIAMHGFRT
jgi:hypothetical protein